MSFTLEVKLPLPLPLPLPDAARRTPIRARTPTPLACCAFRKFCGWDSGNSAASGVIVIPSGELVGGEVLGTNRGAVET